MSADMAVPIAASSPTMPPGTCSPSSAAYKEETRRNAEDPRRTLRLLALPPG